VTCMLRLVILVPLLGLPRPVAAGLYEDAAIAYSRSDYQTALRILRPLAAQGDANAEFNLAVMYSKGDGVNQDTAKAATWYEKAAAQGYGPAQYNLALLYEKGLGVARDFLNAARLYREAAEQGLAEAQNNLCGMYRDGRGVSQNDTEAAKWCLKSAQQGYIIAQYNLGLMYASGDGVKRDYITAYMWLDLAISGSPTPDAEAIHRRDLVAAMMTPMQIAEARRMTFEWKVRSK
jgi:uncharacterized protein